MCQAKSLRMGVGLCILWGLAALAPSWARAQSPDTKAAPAAAAKPADAAKPATPEPTPPNKIDSGDNAWVLVSSALVLMMTGPGLALFYCGLVRKKNVLSVMMQCVMLMGLMSVIWATYGYSLVFSGTNPWIGNLDYSLLRGCQPVVEKDTVAPFYKSVAPVYQYTQVGTEKFVIPTMPTTIPLLTHMLFQGMFFVITPALICGAFAERMKFSTMVVFMILWGTFIYCPLAHWVWGFGVLCYGSPAAIAGGALDFAGGTVVHISSGVSALVCAILIGKRLGYGSEPMPPHNMTYTAIGATMLWVGWFGFNAGSALASNGLTASAFAATHLAAAAGAVAWAVIEWVARGKPTILGACSGAVAGLVCVTPASGFILPIYGIVLGVAVSLLCYFAVTTIKARFGYDDSLDAFGVHGVGGTLGAILTGVFATAATGGTVGVDAFLGLKSAPKLGLIEGGSKLFMGQVVAVLITWALAIVGTFIIIKLLDATMGLRVSKSEEIQGLDYSQHNEEGYIFI